MGISNTKLRLGLFGSILKHYGFSDEALEKQRRCPEPECHNSGTLSYIIAHLNDNHKLRINQIGKLIPYIRDDTRPVPKWHERFVGYFLFFARRMIGIHQNQIQYKTS